jgi:hypothetical protein
MGDSPCRLASSHSPAIGTSAFAAVGTAVGRRSWARRRASSNLAPGGLRHRTLISLRSSERPNRRSRALSSRPARFRALARVSLVQRGRSGLESLALPFQRRGSIVQRCRAEAQRRSSGARRCDSVGERPLPILRRYRSGARRRVPSSRGARLADQRCRSPFERRGAILPAYGSEGRRRSAEAQGRDSGPHTRLSAPTSFALRRWLPYYFRASGSSGVSQSRSSSASCGARKSSIAPASSRSR